MSTCCGRAAGRGGPREPRALGALHHADLPALRPGAGPPPRAHLVVSRHGPAPLQEHVLDAADGCPGCLRVPEQGRGARGCPVSGGMEKARPERWEATESAIREEPQAPPPLLPPHPSQPSHLGPGCSHPLRPPSSQPTSWESPAQPLLACILPSKLVHDGFAVLRTGPPGPGRGCHPAFRCLLLLLLL